MSVMNKKSVLTRQSAGGPAYPIETAPPVSMAEMLKEIDIAVLPPLDPEILTQQPLTLLVPREGCDDPVEGFLAKRLN